MQTQSAICGNGIIDAGEACDGTNVSGLTCASLPGFKSGTLSVTSTNGCGTSHASTIFIATQPATPGGITGPIKVCRGNTQKKTIKVSLAPAVSVTD